MVAKAMTDAEKVVLLRAALEAVMEGSKFAASPLFPEGAWASIRMPSEAAMSLGRDALLQTVPLDAAIPAQSAAPGRPLARPAAAPRQSYAELVAAREAARRLAVASAMADVSAEVRGNARLALRWARQRLMRREGAGHVLQLVRQSDGIVCAFAKPSWPGDHCGTPMPTGAEAVVQSVLEYEADC